MYYQMIAKININICIQLFVFYNYFLTEKESMIFVFLSLRLVIFIIFTRQHWTEESHSHNWAPSMCRARIRNYGTILGDRQINEEFRRTRITCRDIKVVSILLVAMGLLLYVYGHL